MKVLENPTPAEQEKRDAKIAKLLREGPRLVDEVLLGTPFVGPGEDEFIAALGSDNIGNYASFRRHRLSSRGVLPVTVDELVRGDGVREYGLTVGSANGEEASISFDDGISDGDLSSVESTLLRSNGNTSVGQIGKVIIHRSPEQAQVDLYNALKILKVQRDRVRKNVAGRKAAEHLIVG